MSILGTGIDIVENYRLKKLLFKKKSKILNIGNRKGLSDQQIVNYINKRMKKKLETQIF